MLMNYILPPLMCIIIGFSFFRYCLLITRKKYRVVDYDTLRVRWSIPPIGIGLAVGLVVPLVLKTSNYWTIPLVLTGFLIAFAFLALLFGNLLAAALSSLMMGVVADRLISWLHLGTFSLTALQLLLICFFTTAAILFVLYLHDKISTSSARSASVVPSSKQKKTQGIPSPTTSSGAPPTLDSAFSKNWGGRTVAVLGLIATVIGILNGLIDLGVKLDITKLIK